jgi:hypothetical protein
LSPQIYPDVVQRIGKPQQRLRKLAAPERQSLGFVEKATSIFAPMDFRWGAKINDARANHEAAQIPALRSWSDTRLAPSALWNNAAAHG